ncbi:MAG TPA: helix-turn-helix transcriptional regulator [Candidatus Sulfotelmatobacter sp.]|nr:helix-turn-helix transcriptional regulator [Candidatus Sulfotelmatobacter sp.]
MPSQVDRHARIVAAGRRRLRQEMRNLAEVLTGLRLDAGLSQGVVAQAAGISRPYLSAIEAGHRTPSVEVLARLAAALGGDLSLRVYPGTGPALRDHLQVAMTEALLVLAAPSWRVRLEVPIPAPARGYADLVLHDPARRQAVVTEVHSQLRRLEQQLRWGQAKAEAIATSLPAGTQMCRLLLLRSTDTNRRLVAHDPHVFAAAFPAPAADIYDALRHATGQWPGDALLWATVERRRATIMRTPPRGIRVGR